MFEIIIISPTSLFKDHFIEFMCLVLKKTIISYLWKYANIVIFDC